MARRVVLEVQCSRCDRKELVEEQGQPSDAPAPKALTVALGDGTTIQFDDLCGPCKGAVKGHLEAIGKKIEGLSPERQKKASDGTTKGVAKKKSPAKPNSLPTSVSASSGSSPRPQ